jgi:hypothetical protein
MSGYQAWAPGWDQRFSESALSQSRNTSTWNPRQLGLTLVIDLLQANCTLSKVQNKCTACNGNTTASTLNRESWTSAAEHKPPKNVASSRSYGSVGHIQSIPCNVPIDRRNARQHSVRHGLRNRKTSNGQSRQKVSAQIGDQVLRVVWKPAQRREILLPVVGLDDCLDA